MKDWELAEKKVADATKGKIPPGSGSGNLKGDVRTVDWVFEVKQTSKDVFTLSKSWLDKLEVMSKSKEVCLVIFFELRGYCFYYTPQKQEYEPWKTISFKENEIPKVLITENGTWEFDTFESLWNL